MSATAAEMPSDNGIVKQEINECVETGREAVFGAKASLEKPVRNAVEKVKQGVRDCTEVGRETLNSAMTKTNQSFNATKEKAQKLADEGKQRIGDMIESAASYVGGAGEMNGEDGGSNSYAAKIISVADQYVESGRKVLNDAKTSAEAYQSAAVEAVQSKITHGRQQVETYATTAKDSVEPLVDSARGFVNKSARGLSKTSEALREQKTAYMDKLGTVRTKVRTAVDESKPHLRNICDKGKNAVSKRDVRLALTVVAQVFAGLLILMDALFEEALKLTFVKNATSYVQNCRMTQKAWELLAAANIPQKVDRLPVVGHRAVVASTTFLNEVKRSMLEMKQKNESVSPKPAGAGHAKELREDAIPHGRKAQRKEKAEDLKKKRKKKKIRSK
ncbi:hypothetical protein MOQ_010339 [Trypanosoma cruzi marinkellei]|uniref:Uncharacterized protein n=1 Tax=Trypanosoma cruzi marinkellei TaxID=85056 RepID=K2MJX5_TRYCR|nr:hypothetical protein MOQ_010339 [Trypanosoma cruzi marinkellei]